MPLHSVAESPTSTASCPDGLLAAAVSERRQVRGRASLEHAHQAPAEEEPPP
ncbi:hypothetical protein FHT43_006843 [Mycolicibacterium sp. BK607]|uniref:hypothetical protein n=1 Tax=Mycolicibacterium sp. BK607 TaxID=2587098 RepID=UPI00160CBC6E|nr:hypothetical protein [Mycolicibacterium sp. BK607]MBB3636895.1 hypothetical protein [Mycolicibacterium sp. BK607]